MLNIVIPMAGAGSRFAVAGYENPKPLIDVAGLPMIQLVIKNLRPQEPHRFIFICQKSHLERFSLVEKLADWAPGSSVVSVDGLTEGAACTVLAARNLIDNDQPLMIANSDQYIDTDINQYLSDMRARDLDGMIMTMSANDPKWSYVGINDQGLVELVVEKEVISNEATVGIYNFRKGCDFVSAADRMISENRRVNNEFYVAPAYNLLIGQAARIGVCNVGKEADGMYGLGIPADLDLFLSLPVHKKAVKI